MMITLPAPHPEIETLPLFDDAFLLAAPSADALPNRQRISADDIDQSRLILLEEGRTACAIRRWRSAPMPAAARCANWAQPVSPATVMQMVANGYGVTLIPRMRSRGRGRATSA